MTIGYKDKCPNCDKGLTETTNEIAEEHIYEQFTCPYCNSILEFKKNYTWLIIATGGVWLLSLLGKYSSSLFVIKGEDGVYLYPWIRGNFVESLASYIENFEIISNISFLLLIIILFTQHIRIVK